MLIGLLLSCSDAPPKGEGRFLDESVRWLKVKVPPPAHRDKLIQGSSHKVLSLTAEKVSRCLPPRNVLAAPQVRSAIRAFLAPQPGRSIGGKPRQTALRCKAAGEAIFRLGRFARPAPRRLQNLMPRNRTRWMAQIAQLEIARRIADAEPDQLTVEVALDTQAWLTGEAFRAPWFAHHAEAAWHATLHTMVPALDAIAPAKALKATKAAQSLRGRKAKDGKRGDWLQSHMLAMAPKLSEATLETLAADKAFLLDLRRPRVERGPPPPAPEVGAAEEVLRVLLEAGLRTKGKRVETGQWPTLQKVSVPTGWSVDWSLGPNALEVEARSDKAGAPRCFASSHVLVDVGVEGARVSLSLYLGSPPPAALRSGPRRCR